MLFNDLVTHLTRLLVPIAFLATTCLYLYPICLGCVFPSIDGNTATAFQNTILRHVSGTNDISHSSLAPFRLLVLADPQLEGDSSLPDPEDALLQKLSSHWHQLVNDEKPRNLSAYGDILKEIVTVNVPNTLKEVRKRIDLFGNDYYLAHIFRTLHWWTKPTHVTVLGDLVGSQWVDDDEFTRRGWRYWHRVFAAGHKIEDEIMNMHPTSENDFLRMDDPAWETRIINIAGNHDIGYAGDISSSRMERFEKTFGKSNWDIRFQYPVSALNQDNETIQPSLHLVVLNSMLLDTPAMDEDLQGQVYGFLNSVITESISPVEDQSSFTLLLTHVPLHKEEGICVDAPFFDFWEDEDCDGSCKAFALKEQNHLSQHSSQPGLLEALFGMSGKMEAPMQGKGRPGLILNGHDHEGCDVWHHIPMNSTMLPQEGDEESKTNWQAVRWREAHPGSSHTGIREVTLRSMMGDYGGNAGLLSAWFDFDKGRWEYNIQMCKLGVQHIWWAVHVVDLIALGLLLHGSVFRPLYTTINLKHLTQMPASKSAKID